MSKNEREERGFLGGLVERDWNSGRRRLIDNSERCWV